MAKIDDADATTLADGVIAAMVEVSEVEGSVVGEVWESESAQDVLETFQLDAAHGTVMRRVFDLAMDRWPSVLGVLLHEGERLDAKRSRLHIAEAVATAKRILETDDLETYRLAVFNVAAATAAAVGRHLRRGSDDRNVSDDERAVIREIDAMFD